MTTRAFQKIYTKIDNITKATVTLRATGVGNDELATVGGKLAQVVRISGDDLTLQASGRTYTVHRLDEDIDTFISVFIAATGGNQQSVRVDGTAQ